MNSTLKKLFDVQKFVENGELQKIIEDTHKRYGSYELDDEDLLNVNAAGGLSEQSARKSNKDLRRL